MFTTLSPVAELTQLHIDTSYPSSDTARVVVAGEVDLATSPMLRDRLLRLLHDRAPAVLNVGLVGVTFLDCTGISALMAVRNEAARTGRQMRVTHPQPFVRRILDLTGLLEIFTAPIDTAPVDQQQPVTARSEYQSRSGPIPAAVPQSPDLEVAA